jgi:hypothetical protein
VEGWHNAGQIPFPSVGNVARELKRKRRSFCNRYHVPVIPLTALFAATLPLFNAAPVAAFDLSMQRAGNEGAVGLYLSRIFTVNVFSFPLLVVTKAPFCRDLDPDRYQKDVRIFLEELRLRNWCTFVSVDEFKTEIVVTHYRVKDQQRFEADVRALLADPTEERLTAYAFDLRRVREFIPREYTFTTLTIDRLVTPPSLAADSGAARSYGRTPSTLFSLGIDLKILEQFGRKPLRFVTVP